MYKLINASINAFTQWFCVATSTTVSEVEWVFGSSSVVVNLFAIV